MTLFHMSWEERVWDKCGKEEIAKFKFLFFLNGHIGN